MLKIATHEAPQSEVGVSMLEFSIVLPVLLFMIFSIHQFGMILTEKALLTEALRTSARYVASLSENCGEKGSQYFEEKLEKMSKDNILKDLRIEYDQYRLNEETQPVESVRMHAELGIPCHSCEFILGAGTSLITVNSSIVVPLESARNCHGLEDFPYHHSP